MRALPGPVSQAMSSSPGATKVKLATPPMLMKMTGPEKFAAAASARWKMGMSGAPWPPAATSAARKSKATVTRRRMALRKQSGIRNGFAQQRSIGVLVGEECRGSQADCILAVGLDQGGIDAIHRGSAHEADRSENRNFNLAKLRRNGTLLADFRITFNMTGREESLPAHSGAAPGRRRPSGCRIGVGANARKPFPLSS